MSGEQTYDEFWLMYLRAHSRRKTRLIHYLGISVIIVSIVWAIASEIWWIALAGIATGYVTAWSAHYTVQHNVPVMFEGPKSALWSLISGLRMYVLGLSGQLAPQLRRAGVGAE
ncbi:MAG: DUF962 domain-containing protein [Hyphomicrobiaceae bacterium]|nr:DUF962 domain-containing protein [Hyphomicrobiaceae bacterium]